MRRSTSAGSCRCGLWVANAQYLQCDTQDRESDSVTLREKVTRRRIGSSLWTATPGRLRVGGSSSSPGGMLARSMTRRLVAAFALAAALAAAGCARAGED